MITNEEIEKEFNKLRIDDGGRGLNIPLNLDGEQKVTVLSFLYRQLDIQKQEMVEKIEDSINLHKILKLNCKDNDKIEKKEAHDIVIEAFKKLKQNLTK